LRPQPNPLNFNMASFYQRRQSVRRRRTVVGERFQDSTFVFNNLRAIRQNIIDAETLLDQANYVGRQRRKLQQIKNKYNKALETFQIRGVGYGLGSLALRGESQTFSRFAYLYWSQWRKGNTKYGLDQSL
jgi:hypothetical protein